MTARNLRRLRHLALRTLRRTPLVHQRRAPARPRPGCAPALRRTVPGPGARAPNPGGPVNPGGGVHE
ncbi:hypothetical protein [Streptomyces anulatus]|uniref:hypothetical protein n=1 Tax=Streptomyces anulatus TaxID=1892 RepID=UPI0034024C08|nr:hypothetical protein OG391_38435 [Streptomyces anulatus]